MMAPIGRPATLADLIAFYGETPKESQSAFVLDLGGNILGVGGVRYRRTGEAFLFSDIKPEAKRWPKSMLKAAKLALRQLGPAAILALADPNERGSVRLLTYLGFKHYTTSPQGEVFRYVPETAA